MFASSTTGVAKRPGLVLDLQMQTTRQRRHSMLVDQPGSRWPKDARRPAAVAAETMHQSRNADAWHVRLDGTASSRGGLSATMASGFQRLAGISLSFSERCGYYP